jgi:hypothetical protein
MIYCHFIHFARLPLSVVKDCKYMAESMDTPYPINVMDKGYESVVNNNKVYAGSGTACILSIHKPSGRLYSANLGDSGYIVIRNNKVVHRSRELQHYL